MSVRMALALPAAALVALLLLRLMHALIHGGEGLAGGVPRGATLEFIRAPREEATRLREVTAHLPLLPPAEPPSRPPRLTGDPGAPLQPDIEVPFAHVRLPADGVGVPAGFGAGGRAVDGDVVPLVRVDPQWPREALLSGTEGWVLIEFTILADGSVADAQVADAQVADSSPRHLFDRSALRAISRWRFRPRVVEGEPVERRARQRMDFVRNDSP